MQKRQAAKIKARHAAIQRSNRKKLGKLIMKEFPPALCRPCLAAAGADADSCSRSLPPCVGPTTIIAPNVHTSTGPLNLKVFLRLTRSHAVETKPFKLQRHAPFRDLSTQPKHNQVCELHRQRWSTGTLSVGRWPRCGPQNQLPHQVSGESVHQPAPPRGGERSGLHPLLEQSHPTGDGA